jgi:hypothetical protein
VVRLAQVLPQKRRLRLRDWSTKKRVQPAARHRPIVTSGVPQAIWASAAAQVRPSQREAGSPSGAYAITLQRRSLQLRAACGARPHVAAAQAAVADFVGDTEEGRELRAIVAVTAEELDLEWLKQK